jgi:formylglycine-generating enzyme required for sulfatase activity
MIWRAFLMTILVAALACISVMATTNVLATTEGDVTGAEPFVEAMVVVPSGTFIMGDGEAQCGVDEHEVTLTRDFLLGQHEVTNQEYLEAVQWAYDHGYVTATTSSVRDNLDGSLSELLDLDDEDSEIQFDGAGMFYLRESPSLGAQSAYPDGYDPSEHPVKEVTWYGAARFCDWLSLQAGLPRAYEHSGDWLCNGGDPYGAIGYRLPADAEWEYAAQYDDERIYPWGNEHPNCSLVNYFTHTGPCVGWTTPVGSYPDAPELLGLSDMAGNVREYCNDFYLCDLGTDPETDPVGGPPMMGRILRGGGYGSEFPFLRCATRLGLHPTLSFSYGFRIARTATTTSTDHEPDLDRPGLILGDALPNPFTATTRISYRVPGNASRSVVILNVYDLGGHLVRTLVKTAHSAGPHSVSWDGTDQAGRHVGTGVYFYQLRLNGETQTRRMTLVR